MLPMKAQQAMILAKGAGLLARLLLGGLLLGGGPCLPPAQAQVSDALLDKLVDKGILTVKEANDLKQETDAGFSRATAAKSGVPDWVSQMRLYGDVRVRAEHLTAEDPLVVDRTRYRFRLRVGVTATMLDNIEAGFRLTSSDSPSGTSVGDPISGNTTMNGNGSKKPIWIDLAYGKWTPINRDGWTVTGTLGKMENPFVTSDMVFDPDYTPEGAALQASWRINEEHVVKLNGGAFALAEFPTNVSDSFLFGVQARWDGKYGKRENFHRLESTLGVAWYGINSATYTPTNAFSGTNNLGPDWATVSTANLANGSVPNVNYGNTRTISPPGLLVYHYNPIVADAGLTLNLVSFPLYPGVFPLRVAGDYMINPAAPTANTGYQVGVYLGKAGKRRTWELSYRYKWLESDAWYEELVDSDFGAVYGLRDGTTPIPGGASGYRPGTNVKGHIIRGSYSPYDSLMFSVTFFMTDLIHPFPANYPAADSKSAYPSAANRLQVDAMWKF